MSKPDFIADSSVAWGGDGPGVPGDGTGPVLAMLKDFAAQVRQGQREALAEHRAKMRQRLLSLQPAYAPQYASGAVPSSGNLVLDLGGPQKGRRWVVRMVTVSDAGSFWNSMGSAQATICTGQSYGTSGVAPQQVRWPFASLPNSATFSADQMWVVPSDHVLVSVTGGTSGENVQATIWVQDFEAVTALGEELV